MKETMRQRAPEGKASEPERRGLKAGEQMFRFLKKAKFFEARESEEDFENWVQKLTFEQFNNLLTRINGIIREMPIHQRSMDGTGAVRFGDSELEYLPPAPELRESYLQDVFEAIKNVKNNEDRGLLAYYALQNIHPYADGNGRTGRLLYELFTNSDTSTLKERLSLLVDDDEYGERMGRVAFDEEVANVEWVHYYINREVAADLLGEDFAQEYGRIFDAGFGYIPDTIPSSDSFPPEARKRAEDILDEKGGAYGFPFRGLSITKLAQENKTLSSCLHDREAGAKKGEVVPQDVGKKMLYIEVDELENLLSEDDLKRLLEINEEIKRKSVETLIDVFVHPEKHFVRNNKGEVMTLNDLFKRRRKVVRSGCGNLM